MKTLNEPPRAVLEYFPEFIDGYGILNQLIAGRSIGGDRVSHAAVRNMMCCAVSGQGAVQAELRRQGARIQ